MSDHEFMRVWMGLGQAASLLSMRLDKHLQEEIGLSLIEKGLMSQISMAGGRIRMGDLAMGLLLSKAGITKAVDRLESSGLVAREPSTEDRRVTNVVLTEGGEALMQKSKPVMRSWLKEHFADPLTAEELEVMQSAFVKILAANSDPPE